MAKKSTAAKQKKKVVKKKDETVKVAAAPVVAAQPAKGKKGMITAIVIAVLLLLGAEMAFVVQKQAKANKKPVLVNVWDVKYGGQVGMPVSGNNLYVIDSKYNQILRLDKMNGKPVATYQFETEPRWAGETTDGRVFVMLKGDPKIYEMKKNKPVEFISADMKDPINFVLDSQDNFIVSDGGSAKVYKFDKTGNKIAEFGGRGSGKGKFLKPGKVSVDSKDNMYVIENSTPYMVKVFNKDNKFVKEWKIPFKTMNGMEVLVITNDGNVYINDWNDATIKVYSNDGKTLGKWVNDAAMTYKIGLPGAFSGGPDNFIYVGSFNIAVFEPIQY